MRAQRKRVGADKVTYRMIREWLPKDEGFANSGKKSNQLYKVWQLVDAQFQRWPFWHLWKGCRSLVMSGRSARKRRRRRSDVDDVAILAQDVVEKRKRRFLLAAGITEE